MSFRPTLRNAIDREVYSAVLKLEGEKEAENGLQKTRLTLGLVYDCIKRSNSSLARQKKKPLEDAIERVLAVRKVETVQDEEQDSDEVLEERLAREEKRPNGDQNLLNRQIAKAWGFRNKGINNPPKSSEDISMDGIRPFNEPETPLNGGQIPISDRHPNGEPRPKKRKGDRPSKTEVDRTPLTRISIRDVAGVDDALHRLMSEVWFPLNAGEACEKMGFRFDNCVLLHGPSGCGKTTVAHAVAGSIGVAFIPVSAPTIVGGTSGESEKNIREFFDEAIRLAPCLLFIDEIDAIAGKRDSANKGMESRIVSEIMSGMDRIGQKTVLGKNVVVLAATNRPESLDQSIRRRFASEIELGMPNELAREQILRSFIRDLNVADDINFKELARLTPGYVGSDLRNVVKEAVSESFKNSLQSLLDKAKALNNNTLEDISDAQRNWLLLENHRNASWGESRITFEGFKRAISRVQPASKREGFSTIPDTTWANVGALGGVRKKLEMSIIGPIKQPELFASVGIKPAAGILLWGPPGCGKTLVAKAVANESKANFISIKGPELLNKYVGESERAVRSLFARAKSSAPCILFFDEMDALAPRREESHSDASGRVVNALLTELDGVGDRTGIYVIGATNRPDVIDEAIRRPGRLGTSIYVGLPSGPDRVEILKTLYRNTMVKGAHKGPMSPELERELETVALDRRCAGFSGADLGSLMQAAAQACVERVMVHCLGEGAVAPVGVKAEMVMNEQDWEAALTEVKPSVKDPHMYVL